MTFTKTSTLLMFAFASLSCFGANHSETIANALAGMNKDGAKNDEKYAAGFAAMREGFNAGAPGSKERASFAKAVCAELNKATNKVDREFLISLLEVTGGEESLGTLAKLLADKDKDIQDAARMAIEKNSAPSASKVLIDQVGKQKDPSLQAGLVGSVAVRGDSAEFIKKAKASKDKIVVDAAKQGDKSWYESDYAAFYQEFTTKPTKDLAEKAITSGEDRAFILAASMSFGKVPELMSKIETRYNASENPTKGWFLTSLTGNPAAKAFLIKALDKESDPYVQMAAVNALSEIGGLDSAKAVIKTLKSAQNNDVRKWCENSIAAMKADKELDKYLLAEAKNKDKEALRLLGHRGVFEAVPLVMDFIEKNFERGDCCWVLEQLGSDDQLVLLAKIAIDKKDDYLIGRIVPVANQIAKRIVSIDGTKKKLEDLKVKADDKGKAALDRACELVQNRGVMPKKK